MTQDALNLLIFLDLLDVAVLSEGISIGISSEISSTSITSILEEGVSCKSGVAEDLVTFVVFGLSKTLELVPVN